MRQVPKKFVRHEPQGRIAFQSTPTGELDPVRLVNGDPRHWVSPTPAREITLNKLVLSDWRAPFWDDETAHKVVEVLHWLMTPSATGLEEGFEIYTLVVDDDLPETKRLVKLNLDTLESIRSADFRASMTYPDTPETIKKLAYSQLRIAADEIGIIAGYALDQLLHPDSDSESYKLSLHYIGKFFKKNSRVPRIVSLSGVPVQLLIDESSFVANWSYRLLKEMKEMSELPVVFCYQYLDLADSLLNNLLAGQTINSHGVDLKLTELSELSELTISFDEGARAHSFALEKVLQSFSSLRRLQLGLFASIDGEKLLKTDLNETELATFVQLRELVLNFKISQTQLAKVIRLCPNLEKLSLVDCDTLPEELYLGLPKLRELRLNGSSVTAESLIRVLTTKALTVLNLLRHRVRLDGLASLEPNSSTLLDDFSYEPDGDYPLPASATCALLRAAPKIRSFNIDKGDLNGEELTTICASNLPHLTSFTLKNGIISAHNFAALLKAPNLRIIAFKKASFDQVRYCKEDDSLKKLKKISVTDSLITEAEFLSLLKIAPKLDELILGTVILGGEALTSLGSNSLISLKKFWMLGGRISGRSLLALLQAGQKIESLLLEALEDDTALTKLKPQSLIKLVQVIIHNGKLSSASFQSLLMAAPNLSTLKIALCDLLYEELASLEANSLKQLHCLDTVAKISATNLWYLLRAAPQMEIINLVACDLSSDILMRLEPGSLGKLCQLHMNSGVVSMKKLPHFLRAASQLELLSLFYTTLEDNVATEFIDSDLSALKNLQLRGVDIELVSLACLLNIAHKLESLKIRDCSKLSGSLEGLLVRPLNSLRTLEIGSSSLSPSAILLLLNACPYLTQLKLDHSYVAKDAALDAELNKRKGIIQFITRGSAVVDGSSLTIGAHAGAGVSDATTTPKAAPKHQAREFKNLRPTDQTSYRFNYLRANHSKNQAMVIEAFSQYCTLSNRYTALIPKIQDGICARLSTIFLRQYGKLDIIEAASTWDGTLGTLGVKLPEHAKSLGELFEDLASVILDKSPTTLKYIGNNLATVCSVLNRPYAFANPWHRIAIYPVAGTGNWIFYDPNSPAGPIVIKKIELMAAIEYALGPCVSVCTSDALPELAEASISNSGQFIREGGLISLARATPNDTRLMLAQLISVTTLSSIDLQGILLRTTTGIPAWAAAFMNAATQKYSCSLISEFIKKYPTFYVFELRASLEAIAPAERRKLLETISTYKDSLPVAARSDLENLLEAIDPSVAKPTAAIIPSAMPLSTTLNSLAVAIPVQPAATEDSHTLTVTDPTARVDAKLNPLASYFDEIIPMPTSGMPTNAPPGYKNRLIKFKSPNSLRAFGFEFHAYCHENNRPVLYIDKPEDLVCSAPYIYRRAASNLGEIHKVGGPLYDFLTRTRLLGEAAPVLIVNYENFAASDIARLNSLLDDQPKVDNQDVPNDMAIMGLISATDSYQGSDFYSRFHAIDECAIPPKILEARMGMPELIKTGSLDTTVINLFNADDWKARLLGRWVLNDGVLCYEEGELVAASRRSRTIEIQNGPWMKPEFQRFWLDLYALSSLSYPLGRIDLPTTCALVRSEGYDWAALKPFLQIEEHLSGQNHQVLNSSTFSSFFSRYELTAENKLKRLNGFVAQLAKDATLVVHITSALNTHEWAMLLRKCKSRAVKLLVYRAPGVTLPTELDIAHMAAPFTSEPWDGVLTKQTHVIQSTDVDFTVSTLIKEHETEWVVIDVSECHGSDLLERMTGGLDETSLSFKFTKEKCALIKALDEKRKVILTGDFSAKLADDIASLLLKRLTDVDVEGNLVLVSTNTRHLHYASPTSHAITVEQKLNYFAPEERETLKEFAKHETLSQLKVRRDYLLANPGSDSNAAWIGMRKLQLKPTQLKPLDATTSAEEARLFIEQRKALVNQQLTKSPFVFIAGLSGVGKTTFVRSDYLDPNDRLFIGEDTLTQWAESSSVGEGAHRGRQILFIDESTLSHRQWSEFEGLFNTPPQILIHGKLHKLSPAHKVIFAGNPVSYGGGRKLAPLFVRHGNAVFFELLPTAVIYEKSLKPIFDIAPKILDSNLWFRYHGSFLKNHAAEISNHVIEVYRFLIQHSETDVLISPRELQMMALLVISHCSTASSMPEIRKLARHFAYEVALPLVPTQNLLCFNTIFKPAPSELLSLPQSSLTVNQEFFVTASRTPLAQLFDQLLTLRELRRRPEASTCEELSYGGLDGLIVEGDSGIGKSKLVTKALIARGYVEASIDQPAVKADAKYFYRLPVSLSVNQKKEFLLKAFNEGAVVVIDEIYSSPMMEDLLNELLMGLYETKRPKNPGFMIIGTQNPIDVAGRRATTTALSRRLITHNLPPYTREEVLNILIKRGLDSAEATALASQYTAQKSNQRNLRTILNSIKSSTLNAGKINPYRYLAIAAVSLIIGAGAAYGLSLIVFPLLALHLMGLFFVLAATAVSLAMGLAAMSLIALSLAQLTKYWTGVAQPTRSSTAAAQASGRVSAATKESSISSTRLSRVPPPSLATSAAGVCRAPELISAVRGLSQLFPHPTDSAEAGAGAGANTMTAAGCGL